MPDSTQPTSTPSDARPAAPVSAGPGGLFAEPVTAGRSFPTVAVSIAAVAVLAVLALLVLLGRRHEGSPAAASAVQPLAAYAPQIRFSDIALSESTSFAGGKSTFVDGRVTNAGPATVTGMTLQLLFAPEGGRAPQLQTTPLTLVRTRQPYVDTEPVSAAPMVPGGSADFRLIFEDIRPEWNQQPPEIHVIGVTER